jgi:hypothetical protein
VKRIAWAVYGLLATASVVALPVFAQSSEDRTAAEDALAHVLAASSGDGRDGGVDRSADGGARVVSASDGGTIIDPSMTRGPVLEARRALERARGARAAGDPVHADLLDGLAREWAETARDVVRAAAVEQEASALESTVAELSTRAQRARALLEEDVARRGRAEAELARVARGGKPSPSSASSAETRPRSRPPSTPPPAAPAAKDAR